MSKPSDEIVTDIITLLKPYERSTGYTVATLRTLTDVMESKDASEFVRLMQKWLASV